MPQRSRYIEGHKLQELFDTAASFGKYTNEGFRTIPCSPDFVGVIGQVYEEGKDYKLVKRVIKEIPMQTPMGSNYIDLEYELTAIPIKEEENQEIWRPVTGYEQFYEISNFGRVKRLRRPSRNNVGKTCYSEIILKQWLMPEGYLRINLRNDNKKVRGHLVHRLVGLHFIDNPDDKPEINHVNGIKTDNRASNLEWTDRTGNNRHAFFVLKAKAKPVIQLSHAGELVAEYDYVTEAARKTGISKENIYGALNGRQASAGGYIWQRKQ